MSPSVHFSSICHSLQSPMLIPRNFSITVPVYTAHWNKRAYSPLKCPYSKFPPLRCSTSDSTPSPEQDLIHPSSRVFVKGLSLSTSEGQLARGFSHFGKIIKVKIITSKSIKESLGLAYIWFSCQQEALSAIEQMNGKFFHGRFITVMMAKPESASTQVKAKPYKF